MFCEFVVAWVSTVGGRSYVDNYLVLQSKSKNAHRLCVMHENPSFSLLVFTIIALDPEMCVSL